MPVLALWTKERNPVEIISKSTFYDAALTEAATSPESDRESVLESDCSGLLRDRGSSNYNFREFKPVVNPHMLSEISPFLSHFVEEH